MYGNDLQVSFPRKFPDSMSKIHLNPGKKPGQQDFLTRFFRNFPYFPEFVNKTQNNARFVWKLLKM
jgi:hypothetical protein